MLPDLDDAAQRILVAHRSGRPIERLPESCRPTRLAHAYAVQDAVAEALGPVAGWKVGMASADDEPSCAPVFARAIHAGGATLEAARFHRLALEVEFAFRIDRDLPARDRPYEYEEIASSISFVPLIEVVGGRFADPDALTAVEKLADQNANGAFIVGDAVTSWRGLDFRRLIVELSIGGRIVQHAVGTHPAGDPVLLVRWQAHHASSRKLPLRQGDIVTTGSLQGMSPVGEAKTALGDWGAGGRVDVVFR